MPAATLRISSRLRRNVSEQKLTEERLLRQSALLRVINQALEKTLVCESGEEAARECIALAEQLTGSKLGLIGTVSGSGCLNAIVLSGSGWNACRIPHADAVKMLGDKEVRGILGRAMKEGKSLMSNNPASHPDSVGLPAGHVPVTAILIAPLKRGEETFGLVALANKEGGYDSSDQEMLEALSAVFAESLIRKQAEEALRKKEEEFLQAQKMEAVGALAGGVAHEFNNLLQAIRAFTKFAMKGLSPEETRYRDLQEVLKASERAATLTRQLLGVSRRQQFQMTDMRLNELLVDLKKMLKPLIGEKIELQNALANGVGLLHADPTMIQQVVLNLCINARDAMPSGGKLLIKTEDAALGGEDCPDGKPGRYVRLTVSDTGIGMPPDVLKRIFEPFFSTKGVGKGTGLGLSMVYGAVQQHRGMIRARSEPGQGAAFEIDLPVARGRRGGRRAGGVPLGQRRGGDDSPRRGRPARADRLGARPHGSRLHGSRRRGRRGGGESLRRQRRRDLPGVVGHDDAEDERPRGARANRPDQRGNSRRLLHRLRLGFDQAGLG